MNYKIETIPSFEKELKDVSKKYHYQKSEFAELIKSLEQNPVQGVPPGKDCFKIRLAIQSRGKGKSGVARVITCVKIAGNIVYLLSIFDKAEKENVTHLELKELLNEI